MSEGAADGPNCPGENPSQVCRTSMQSCIPSTCGCSPNGWVCTADCGGGRNCNDGGAGDTPEARCRATGGTPRMSLCCQATGDFPGTIATDRLSMLDDGGLELQLKRPWRDGTTAFVFQPREIIERLVAVVPRPRAHLIRYRGVLAPAFAARAEIVPVAKEPAPPTPSPPPVRRCPGGPAGYRGPLCCGGCSWPTCSNAPGVADACASSLQ